MAKGSILSLSKLKGIGGGWGFLGNWGMRVGNVSLLASFPHLQQT